MPLTLEMVFDPNILDDQLDYTSNKEYTDDGAKLEGDVPHVAGHTVSHFFNCCSLLEC